MANRLLPAQIRGARGMLNWSMVDLAAAARVSVSTVKRVETAMPQPVSDEIYLAIQAALETAGVHLLDDMGDGIGMRMSHR